MKWATKPSIFLSSCWTLCVLGVPFLWVTSNKPLRNAREWKWEFGVHGLSCLNLSPWSDSTNSLLPFALSRFSTRVCFSQPYGKMHHLFHHWIYCETNCFLNVWNQCKQNQEAWFVVYLKHGFLCAIPASCMMWDSGLCISIPARKCWSNLPSSLKSNTTIAQEDDMLPTAGIKYFLN